MAKRLSLTIAMVLTLCTIFAQSAVVPAGGTATGNGGTVTYTVGQPAIQNVNGANGNINEGVQQPYEFLTVGVNDFPGINLSAVVFPNPTHDLVQLAISGFEIPEGGLSARLFDNNGKLLEIFTVADDITTFDLSNYPSATYQLSVWKGKKVLKTFKVVKNK